MTERSGGMAIPSTSLLDALDEAGDMVCPFCGDTGYDRIGLKHHLQHTCDKWDATPPVDFVRTMETPNDRAHALRALVETS